MKPLVIIGIDPGTTTAYALLTLQGELLKVRSAKEFALSDLITDVLSVAQPVLVCTDKAKVPSFVRDYAVKTGGILVVPDHDLLKEEKRELVSRVSKALPLNNHEWDSCAAALYGYKKYFSRLRKIERFIRQHHLEQQAEEFLRMALKEDFHFLFIEELLTAIPEERKNISIAPTLKEKDTILSLFRSLHKLQQEKRQGEQRIEELMKQLSLLQQENKFLTKRSSHFSEQLDRLLKFKEERIRLQSQEIEGKETKMQRLHAEIDTLYQFLLLAHKKVMVKKFATLSQQHFLGQEIPAIVVRNDTLFIATPSIYSADVLSSLADLNVLLLSFEKFPLQVDTRFMTLHVSESDIVAQNKYFVIFSPAVLEQRIKGKNFIEHLITEYKQKRGWSSER